MRFARDQTSPTRRFTTACTAVCLVAVAACEQPPNYADPVWPDADGSAQDSLTDWDTGLPGGRTDAKDVGDGAAGPTQCLAHVLQCVPGQGCHDGECGACVDAGECRALEGCVGGKCGMCNKDSDCKSPKACINGFCLRKPVRKWDLLVDPVKWKGLQDNPDLDTYIPCKLKVDDKVYGPCDVRVRGGITRSYPKLGYRIRFPEDAENPGYSRKINLRAEYNDPTFMRNFLANWLFDQVTDVPTPRVRYRRLLVNGVDHGLYTEMERIGESFRRKRGRDPSAPLYEADPGHEIAAKGAAAMMKVPAEIYPLAYQSHNNGSTDYKDLIGFIEDVVWTDYTNKTSVGIRPKLAVGWYLDYLAVQAAIMNADHVRKNYYLSLQQGPVEKLWEFYPWDLDMSFGCVWIGGADKNLCTKLSGNISVDIGKIPDGVQAAYGGADTFYNVLIHIVLSANDLHKQFAARICKIVASKTWNETMPKLIDALESALLPEVLTDTRDLNNSSKEFTDHVAELRQWIEKRNKVLKFDLDCP